ncbi:DUF790 family protein [Halobacteria archaeon AArc-curdl1]|uniref:DUF790 family protein n=1 Tax=Natronosalvus hydrolyticus TaxID=2979988 RepID=A0AAP2ZB80_9EURY|nr:DUF790 family protein [Halobacteria archaeon AArc-curdl1]
MLRKDLLRVSRAGGGYQPQFAGREHRPLAARVIGTFQGHLGETRGDLETALADLEGETADFKLVRGFAALLEREASFETDAPVDPERARPVVFEAAETVGVVTESERLAALESAGNTLELTPETVEMSLFADLEDRQVLWDLDVPWTPDELLAQYNLSLAQTALFDATSVRIRSSDPKALVSAVKRLRLLYEIERTDAGRVVVVTGPNALFQATRRYGTRFARLLRTVVGASEWSLEAAIDDRGTERVLQLSQADPLRAPDAEPVTDVTYDSDVEADFATRFEALDLEWDLHREPEPLATGTRVMIPDFAFDYQHADFRVYFEIMGFWTPEYVEKKLGQLEDLEDVEMVVAVDESLAAEAEIEARDHRAIPYRNRVRVKDVVDVLRSYERDLIDESVAILPDSLIPEADVCTLESLADEHEVSEAALDSVTFPEHERLGRTLVRPAVLESLEADLEEGLTLETVESRFEAYELEETSAVLSKLGYRIEWEGLGGGVLRRSS